MKKFFIIFTVISLSFIFNISELSCCAIVKFDTPIINKKSVIEDPEDSAFVFAVANGKPKSIGSGVSVDSFALMGEVEARISPNPADVALDPFGYDIVHKPTTPIAKIL